VRLAYRGNSAYFIWEQDHTTNRDNSPSRNNSNLNNLKHLILPAVLLACVSLLLTIQAGAQVLFGSVVGTVTDQTGAAVPGATVLIT
jgi:hypothetical protein